MCISGETPAVFPMGIFRIDVPTARNKLKEIIQSRSLLFTTPERPFVLSSGQTSTFYVDGKKAVTSAEGLYCLSRLIWEEVQLLKADSVGGPTLGADPIAAGLSMFSYLAGRPIDSFIVRKDNKTHGARRRIEGADVRGKRVILVEDVITTGASVLSAIQAVREERAEIVEIIALIDREEGAAEVFRKGQMKYKSIFKISELLDGRREASPTA
ncbi:MAG: orotate phosphoribosyltransferase [bacterium]|nr:orotate phosphoribosyltransferase [bacterium]